MAGRRARRRQGSGATRALALAERRRHFRLPKSTDDLRVVAVPSELAAERARPPSRGRRRRRSRAAGDVARVLLGQLLLKARSSSFGAPAPSTTRPLDAAALGRRAAPAGVPAGAAVGGHLGARAATQPERSTRLP